jgi:hypothetical protein
VAALFVLGTGVALRRVRDPRTFLLLVWVGLTFFLGGVLTADPPFWPHLNIALPAIALLAALGATVLLQCQIPWIRQQTAYVLRPLFAALLVVTAWSNWTVYYAYASDNSEAGTEVARFIGDLPAGAAVILVSDSFHADEYAFQFYAADATIQDLAPETLLERPPLTGPRVIILVGFANLVAAVRDHFPDAVVQEHFNQDGQVVFVSFEVPGP